MRESIERAKALLAQMTVQEKAGQLNQRLYGFNIYKRTGDKIELTDDFKAEVEKFGGIGVLYGLYRADPWADKDETTGIIPEIAMEAYNKVQRYVIEHSRLHIPMMVSTECPHGHQALDGGLLPVNLAVGATFNPELLKEAYAACGEQLADNKVDLALMSVLDILRDPRWGRSEECYSEDSYLASELAYAAISGMQSSKVTAVSKHLCAQGQTTGGVNASAALIGERELREIHLPVVKAVCDAKTGAVMAAYNEIDGVYCHANKKLLTDILRDEFGFEGFVMADGCALDALNVVTGDSVKSGAKALKAGVDVSLWDRAFTLLPEALEKGYITEEELDRAVLRVLTLKFERGLFDDPYMKHSPKRLEGYDIKKKSRQLALESAVLLKNNGVLPIKSAKKLLVCGPNADEIYRQLGDYTPPVDRTKTSTVLDGIKRVYAEGTEILFAPGAGLFEADDTAVQKAAELARGCDAVIAVVGSSSSRFESVSFDINGAALKESRISMDCGEGRDVADIALNLAQDRLIAELAKTGTPVITVVISGRPLGIRNVINNSAAVLQCFYPGPYGGDAIADIISGKASPSGRLPVSIPASSGNIPAYYNSKDSYKPQNYSDGEDGILYAFGVGMSYSKFEFKNTAFECRTDKISSDKQHVLSFTVKNTGDMTATAVPMLFLHHRMTEAVQRRRELKWFKRIELKPGEEKHVEAVISEEAFMTYNAELKRVKEEGMSEWFLTEGFDSIENGEVVR